MKKADIHIFETEELACSLVGLDNDEIDADSQIIEEHLYEKYGMDLEQFHLLMSKLLPMIEGKKQSEYMSADAIERSKQTRFKKGNIPHNALEVGSEVIRVSKGLSYYMIKVPNQSKLVYKHTWLWEQANGAVPKGFNIVFKNGNSLDCRLENLECISNAELMERNTIHQYPPELAAQTMGGFSCCLYEGISSFTIGILYLL